MERAGSVRLGCDDFFLGLRLGAYVILLPKEAQRLEENGVAAAVA